MIKHVLAAAALSAAIGLSVSGASAAPATNMLETLKFSAAESNLVQEARHRRVYRKKMCWWGDRWMCRYFW